MNSNRTPPSELGTCRNKPAQFRREFLRFSGPLAVPEQRGLVPAYVSPSRIAEVTNWQRHYPPSFTNRYIGRCR